MRSIGLIIALPLISLLMSADAFAAEQRLDCVLTDTGEQLASNNGAVSVEFDEGSKALRAQDGSRTYSFNNVSISNIAISGDVDTVSLGIDRSSWGIVWQQYGANKVVTEFGQCKRMKAGD
jgi:hypothetical protein